MQSVSCTRILGNKHNLVRTAAVAASAQRASSQLLQLSQQRRGNGRMVLSGPYTGAADSVIDVEVLAGPAGALRASAPVINGVGNGTLAVQSIDVGAAAQTLNFTLLDAGRQPEPALLDFFGVQLAAQAQGAAGNACAISVVRNLTFTDLPFATLERMGAGSNSFDGPQFDWGQPAATGADIPAGALRMAFAGLPTVHRAWKSWDKGRFMYHLDPPLAYDVPEDTRIREVSGNYTLTVTDGVTTEVYTSTTMHEFLAEVQARSALVRVLGVVAQDRAPGGQAVTDIPLRTDAHALPVIASVRRGGATMQVGAVLPGAATQNLTVTCLGRSGAGAAEAWSVVGGVAGPLPAAYTGQLYTEGPAQFTIGVPNMAATLGAAITGRFAPASRDATEGLPAICFKPLLLGTAATDKEVTFELRQRPPEECSCNTARPLKVNLQCLGLGPLGGLTMDADYQTRLIALHDWHAGFVGSNVALVGLDQADIDVAVSCTSILGEALAEIYEVPAAATAWDSVFEQLKDELLMYTNLGRDAATVPGSGSTPGAEWAPRAMVAGRRYVNPVNHHGYLITAITVDGTVVGMTPADAALPGADDPAAWLTNGTSFDVNELTDIVLTVTDMGPSKSWGDFVVDRVYDVARSAAGAPAPTAPAEQVRVLEILVDGMPDSLPAGITTYESDRFDAVGILHGEGNGGQKIEVRTERVPTPPLGATVVVGQEIVNTLSHHGYRVDAIEVAAVAVQSACARLPGDGSALWLKTGTAFDLAMPAAARASLVLTVTDTGLDLPAVASGLEITIPSAPGWMQPEDPGYGTWYGETDEAASKRQAYNAAIESSNAKVRANNEAQAARFKRVIEYFPKKYAARMDWCRAIAGIPPKSDAGSAGSPCWRDFGDSYWWEDVEGFYLPAFTNQPFVSARRLSDGRIVGTQEFGFGLVTQCDHRLKAGDRITIKISGTHNQAAWAEGDRFVIPLIGAASAPLTGGADGDPTQTWTVRSSVLGALPDWAWLPSAPTPWAHAPATVALSPGGIAFEVGDSVAFDIEGGRLRWRRDAGAWLEADLYAAAPHALGDGLQLQAAPGAAPSFLGDDAWQFLAVATHGTARMRQPRIGQAFAWDGANVVLDIDLGAARPLEAVMLALHSIDAAATVTVSGGLADAAEWSVPAEVCPAVILAVLPDAGSEPARQARYLQVSIANAGAGGAIGWLWAGMGWRPTVGPSRMTRQRQYGLARGAGINPAALYRGAGTGGRWSWSLDDGGALLADNAQALLELIDHSAAEGLEPVALIPDLYTSADASIALIDADEIELEEMNNWQAQGQRVVSVELPLRAVLA